MDIIKKSQIVAFYLLWSQQWSDVFEFPVALLHVKILHTYESAVA